MRSCVRVVEASAVVEGLVDEDEVTFEGDFDFELLLLSLCDDSVDLDSSDRFLFLPFVISEDGAMVAGLG